MNYYKAFQVFAISVLLRGSFNASEAWPDNRSETYNYNGTRVTNIKDTSIESPFYTKQRLQIESSPFSDEEVAIMRNSTTNYDTIKTCYDRKGNLISIFAWDRRTGQDRPVNLNVLANPIIKDEIESTVAKLRVVYNNYGEIVSKQAWNKVTGEKIAVPKTIPFANYIDEDKYWAWVEKQKLYERTYADLYVDRGAVRTKRMKSLMRYNNPFGVIEEVEVYEERPIIERYFADSLLRNDAFVGIFNANFSGSISGLDSTNTRQRTSLNKVKGTYFELGANLGLFNRRFDLSYTDLSESSTLVGGVDFNGKTYAAGDRFDFDLKIVDVTYKKPLNRSDTGDFGLNAIFSLKLMDMQAMVTPLAGLRSTISGTVGLPLLGIEAVKNFSDHFDAFAYYKMFSLSDVEVSEYEAGAKYYFYPENVDDWRFVTAYKGLEFDAKDNSDHINLNYKGLRFALERSF